MRAPQVKRPRSITLTRVVFISLALSLSVAAQERVDRVTIEGSNGQWYVEGGNERAGDARLADFLGRPSLWLKNSTQVMRSDVEFVDGTIEFDLAPMQQGNFVGIIFRRVSFGNHENIYLRLHRSGLYNAVQYAPRMNFSPTWQLYPEFNAVAEFPRNAWTHVRVEVRGPQMGIYVNKQDKPVLAVDRLRGTTDKGSISFWARVNDNAAEWAAALSNISIRPSSTTKRESVSRAASPDGTLRSWELGAPLKAEIKTITKVPEVKEWKAVEAEESGLININRAFRRSPTRATVFARTTVNATQARLSLLELGYSDDVTVFLNGEPVYSGVNGFESRHPEYMGFVKAEYERIFLKLRPGNNELILAITDDQRFGWGFIARLKEDF